MTIITIRLKKIRFKYYYYLINRWLSKQSFAALASGRSTQARVLDSSPRTEDLSSSCLRELETLDWGTNIVNSRKLKAQRLRWATAWRRLHKKIKQAETGKIKRKRNDKQEEKRAIEGVTLETINKLKNAKAEDKKALAEEAIREIKERKKAQIAKRQGDKKTVNKEKQNAQKAQDKAAQKAQKKAAPKKGKWSAYLKYFVIPHFFLHIFNIDQF